jgi:hypothetical protein
VCVHDWNGVLTAEGELAGASFSRGLLGADAIANVSLDCSRNALNEINLRLQETRAILRTLILDLKLAGIFGETLRP